MGVAEVLGTGIQADIRLAAGFSIASNRRPASLRAVTRRCRPLLPLAGLLLALLSAMLWQFRFEPTGPALGLHVGGEAPGWVILGPDRFRIDAGTWTLLPAEGRKVASAEGLLPGMKGERLLHVAIDATWENITRKDDRSWWSARISLAGRQADGRTVWPQDGDLINAHGNRGWHRVECVFELPPDIGEPRLFINNLAATGTLAVRRLTVTPVRERPWVPAATGLLVLGWLAWTAAMSGRRHGFPRQAASSALLVAAGWLLVFPQPHFHSRPFPGGFALGGEMPHPPGATNPSTALLPPLVRIEVPPVITVTKPKTAPLEAGTDHLLVKLFRKIDHDWRFAHFAAFCGVGLALFTLLGWRESWLFSIALAGLSEVIPNLLLRDFGADDAVDLVANFAGLGLAAVLVEAARRWIARRRRTA